MRFLPFLIFLLPFGNAAAQLTDDFADGNFTTAPAWFGDTAKYRVEGQELQLFDESAGSSNLATLAVAAATSTAALTEWQAYIRLEFSPSASNFARFYLSADDPNLTAALSGYYVQIGGVSGSDDAVELYRQNPNDRTLLIAGTSGGAGGSTVEVRVRVTRSPAGEWTLGVDYEGDDDFTDEGSITDNAYPTGAFAGVTVVYSSSRSDKAFFDDLLIDPLFVDTQAPTLLTATADDANTVTLTFDEAVNGFAPANFSVDNGLGIPSSAAPGVSPTQVILTFANAFAENLTYTATASGVADANGNAAGAQTATFTFTAIATPFAYGVVLNEIFADPTPPVTLPNAEFVELYNRSTVNFQLADWGFSSGGTPVRLPAFLLRPGDYVLLTDEADAAAFGAFGPVIGVPDFPALTNGGDQLSLLSPDDLLVDFVDYDADWYGSSDKADGGWTLERIAPDRPCAGADNWLASEDLRGGTPGTTNSIFSTATDTDGPQLRSVFPLSATELLVTFDETIGTAPVSAFSLPGILISAAEIDFLRGDQVVLTLGAPLAAGQVFELSINAELTDCIGNAAVAQIIGFGLPEAAAAGDVVLNEILFNPATGGERYVELYNRSTKIIDLTTLLLARVDSTQTVEAITAEALFFPDTYVVLTEDRQDVLDRYTVPFPGRLLENELPPMNNEAGNLTLYTIDALSGLVVLDAFDYSADFHSALLDDENGVALERLDPGAVTQSAGNWFTAAATAGFGTPTGQNSQLLIDNPTPVASPFVFSSGRVSPDGDGFEDVVLLNYELDLAGYLLNARIYDAAGQPVRELANNLLLATRGSLPWDGSGENGERLRFGIYVCWLEYFEPGGTVARAKLPIVVAGKL